LPYRFKSGPRLFGIFRLGGNAGLDLPVCDSADAFSFAACIGLGMARDRTSGQNLLNRSGKEKDMMQN